MMRPRPEPPNNLWKQMESIKGDSDVPFVEPLALLPTGPMFRHGGQVGRELRRRIKVGIRMARERGVRVGRPRIETPEIVAFIWEQTVQNPHLSLHRLEVRLRLCSYRISRSKIGRIRKDILLGRYGASPADLPAYFREFDMCDIPCPS